MARRRIYSRDLLLEANGGVMPETREELVRLLRTVRVFPDSEWPMAEENIELVVAVVFDPHAATRLMHDRVVRKGVSDGKA